MEEPQSTETVGMEVMVKESDSMEKADSGMDEDSQHSSVQDKSETNAGEISDNDKTPALRLEDSDDSDNDDITIKPKKRMTTLLDDDDDDDSSLPGPLDELKSTAKFGQTAEEVLNAVLNSNDTDEDSDSESSDNETLRAVTQKRKKKLPILDESSNDSSVSGRGAGAVGPSTSELKKPEFGNSDLFDAEEDSDRNSGDEPAKSSNDEADDEGFDESTIDPKLLKQLKKGAAKKETARSKRKAKEEAILNIHSETQRMVRESRINIPYHKPSPRPLQDFLGRALQKQQQYKALKGTSHSRKAELCEEVLSKTRFSSPQLSSTASEDMEVDLSGDRQIDDTSVSSQPTEPEVPQTGTEGDNDSLPDLELNSVRDKIGDGDICQENKSTCTPSEEPQTVSNSIDFDELPDLVIEQEKTNTDKEEKLKMESSFELQGNEGSCNSKEDTGVYEKDLCKEDCAMEVCNTSEKPNSANTGDVSNKCPTEDTPGTKLSSKVTLGDLPSLPRLSGGPNSFISLDEDSGGSTPKNTEMSKFMERFLKHSKKKEKKTSDHDVQISVVQKEKMSADREELKESSFTYHATPIEENPLLKLDTPGAKLLALKSQLSVVMAQKREKNRVKHQQVYDLDNEAGFEGDDEEALLDDEAEMSDHSDTDVEDDDFDEQFGDAEEEFEQEEESREKNPFMDDEAEDDEESEKEDGDLNLKLQLSDDEDEEENEEEVVKVMSTKKKSRVLQISDDEDSNAVSCSMDSAQQSVKEIESVQQSSGSAVVDNTQQSTAVVDSAKSATDVKSVEKEVSVPHFLVPHSLEESRAVEEFSPFSNHLASMTTSPTQKKRPNLPLPIEDSQDLYGNNQALPPTQTQSEMPLFYLEDSQSQMLDADGFLKVGSTNKKTVRSFSLGNTDNAESSDMDELLGLCSGRFDATQSEDKKSCKSLFGTQQTQGNMEELLGLCSGQFAGSGKTPKDSQKPAMKRKLPLDDDEEEEEEFRIVSDEEETFNHNNKNELSDDEDNAGDGHDTDDVEDSGDEVDGAAPRKFTGFTAGNKHGLIKKDFVDEEAELSGSEYDSDENLDIAEEDDFMEMEEGDKDVTVGEEELRNQVGRAHLKQLIDEDKRELMRFQEMYLQDGDLHSEGAGRKRQFRWRNIDDDTQQDMFGSESEGEKEDEEGENELKWRKERFEREKWLKEQMEQEKEGDESQFFKFGKVFLKRRESDTSNSSISVPRTPTDQDIAPKRKDTPTPNLFKLAGQKRGSFLSRDKDSLAKIAEFNKGGGIVNTGGPRNSRNLTFQVISPGKDKENKSGTKVSGEKPTVGPRVRKAHTPNTKHTPAAKKPRLEKKESSFSQNSIFNHI